MYYTYMVRCADTSIYTGMTNNLEKRINEHINKSKNGAKYTKSHNAIKLETAWKSKEKSLACKLEYQIKQLSKQQKEQFDEIVQLFYKTEEYYFAFSYSLGVKYGEDLKRI